MIRLALWWNRAWHRFFALPALLLLLPGAALAQEDRTTAPAPAERIFRRALTGLRTHRLLAELCETAPHRLSGSSGEKKAVAWARRVMEESGFENVRLEPVTVPRWVRGEVEELSIVGPPEERLRILALGGSVATPEKGITAEVIEVRSFEELAKRSAKAKGKIVFFNRPMDPTLLSTGAAYGGAVPQRMRGAIEAAKAGGVAAVVRSVTTRLDDVPHTGMMRYEDGVPRVPAAAVSTLGAERISALLARGRPVSIFLRLDCRTLVVVESANVLGELRGREKPEEIVLVGAHLDCWDVGQGAHDDGAGCSQAIEAVRLLMDLGLRPRRTIRVVLFANEENGLRGGTAYARDHAAELASHVFALESDAGGFTPRGFGTNANPKALAILQDLVKSIEPAGAANILKGGGGADIGPMAKAGVILVGFQPDTQRYFDYHHAETDTIDKVNEREIELGTACIATLIHAVADLEDALPRNPLPEKE